MKLSQLILLAVCLAVALSGVVPVGSTGNPVNPNNVLGFLRFNSLDYCGKSFAIQSPPSRSTSRISL